MDGRWTIRLELPENFLYIKCKTCEGAKLHMRLQAAYNSRMLLWDTGLLNKRFEVFLL